jgi:hypothetical protein
VDHKSPAFCMASRCQVIVRGRPSSSGTPGV